MDFLKWENRKTKRWIKKNIEFVKQQVCGNSIAIDFRCLESIVNTMKELGFEEGRDFIIEER